MTQNSINKNWIFLSFVKEDQKSVEDVYNKLFEADINPWMSSENLVGGQPWKNTIQKAIRSSDFFIVFLSENSVVKRSFFETEIQEALNIWQSKRDNDIYLIPVRIDDCDVPHSLQNLHWIDLFEKDGFDRLMKAINIGKEKLNKEKSIDNNRDLPKNSLSWEKIGAFAFGAIFISIMLFISFFTPEPSSFQKFVFRIVLAVAVTGIGVVAPGFLQVEVPPYARAGGAIALFIIVYWFNPPTLLEKPTEAQPPKTKETNKKPNSSSILNKNDNKSNNNLLFSNEKWAVIIGIDIYPREINGFKEHAPTVKNLRSFRKCLETNFGFEPKNIFSLFNGQATKKNIEQLLGNDLKKNISNQASVIVYFSGEVEKISDSSGFLVPFDGNIKNLYPTCILMSHIIDYANLLKCREILFIIDTSYSGMVGRTFAEDQRTRNMDNNVIQILSSTSPERHAFWDGNLGGSIFNHFLLKGLNGEADYNHDRIIDIRELDSYLSAEVSKQTNKSQIPKLYTFGKSNIRFGFRKTNEEK